MAASALEKEARTLARVEAERGLPRHDLPIQEPLEVEKQLSQRALQVYWQWHRDVRRRVDGALAGEIQRIKAALTAATALLGNYEDVRRELALLAPRSHEKATRPSGSAAAAIPSNQELLRVNEATVLEERSLSAAAFWPLIVVLVGVEFLANAPVFAELIPQDLAFNRQMVEWAGSGAAVSWASGFTHLLGRVLTYPDASLIALAIMTFVLVLGHILGAGVANWLALGRKHPEVPADLSAQMRRRSGLVITASVVGIVIVLSVLFAARRSVLPMAQRRLAQATEQSQRSESEYQKAISDDDESSIRARRDKAVHDRDVATDTASRVEYANSIATMNLPILGLNIVLVIVAAILGLKRHEVVVTAARKRAYATWVPAGANATSAPDDPVADRISHLRSLLRSTRTDLGIQLSVAETSLGRASQLTGAAPMREWNAITRRLAGVIHLFRSENARLRHLDSRDIRAFDAPALIDFPPPSLDVSTELAAQLEGLRERLQDLQFAHDRIARPVRVAAAVPPAFDLASAPQTGAVS
jgi:hypothetical protein